MRKPSSSTVIATVALFVALGGAGMAATGGSFILGQSNSADKTTTLAAPVAGGKTLQVTNNDMANPASTALGLNVAANHAPFTVNTGVRVTNLNADRLDGADSTYFLPKSGKAADSNTLDGIDSSGFVRGQARYRTINVSFETNTGLQIIGEVGQLIFYENCVDNTGTGIQSAFLDLEAAAAHAAFAGLPSTQGGARYVGSGDMPASVPFTLADVSGDLTEGAIVVPAIGTAVDATGAIIQYDLLMTNGAGSAGCHIAGSLVEVS